MATQAKLGKGTLLKVGDAGSPETFTTIPEILEISGTPGGTPDEVDVTNHDTTGYWRETLSGLITAKTLTVRANWNKAGSSGNTALMALQTQMEAGTTKNFQIVLPTTAAQTVTFASRVMDWQVLTPIEGQMTCEFTLKSTGSPTWS
jgi:predicted secreted protein